MNTPRSAERNSRAAVASSAWLSTDRVVRLIVVALLCMAPANALAENGFSNENPASHSQPIEAPAAHTSGDVPAVDPAAQPIDAEKSPRLALAPPGEVSTKSEKSAAPGSWTGLIAAGVVAGGASLALWFLKPAAGASNGRPPEEVLAVLGRAPLGDRQSLHVVRFGAKLLLVNVAAGASRTLSEIDDPDEVERLERLCRGEAKRAAAAPPTPSIPLPKRSSRVREAVDA